MRLTRASLPPGVLAAQAACPDRSPTATRTAGAPLRGGAAGHASVVALREGAGARPVAAAARVSPRLVRTALHGGSSRSAIRAGLINDSTARAVAGSAPDRRLYTAP